MPIQNPSQSSDLINLIHRFITQPGGLKVNYLYPCYSLLIQRRCAYNGVFITVVSAGTLSYRTTRCDFLRVLDLPPELILYICQSFAGWRRSARFGIKCRDKSNKVLGHAEQLTFSSKSCFTGNQIVATAACARNSNIYLTQHYLATHVFELQLQEAHHQPLVSPKMPQDGRSDHQEEPAAAEAKGGQGSVLLTLCISSTTAPGYQHAVAPFPSSYEDACMDALEIFAPYLPVGTEAVSVRVARQRPDGERVWSIVRAKDWNAVLKKDGEELGVFTPDMVPATVSYTAEVARPLKVYIRLCTLSFSEKNIIKSVSSFEELRAAADKVLGYGMVTVKYDTRMLGTQDNKNDYLNGINELIISSNRRPELEVLEDMDSVYYLAGLFAEPLTVYVL
ncbi:hypothetical protein D9619_002262 [Psilocybe cf. subviscida]|uniref:Uncharacterized protein n=1 Tax=Psilocybe cf. subviscida TaxID=2480587 RepID=A0A8H5F463_9AGAR|nr:hypothetical protein D9619_002262 [Psilocybe cf. subviscida]